MNNIHWIFNGWQLDLERKDELRWLKTGDTIWLLNRSIKLQVGKNGSKLELFRTITRVNLIL